MCRRSWDIWTKHCSYPPHNKSPLNLTKEVTKDRKTVSKMSRHSRARVELSLSQSILIARAIHNPSHRMRSLELSIQQVYHVWNLCFLIKRIICRIPVLDTGFRVVILWYKATTRSHQSFKLNNFITITPKKSLNTESLTRNIYSSKVE
jgi:hypothetical protein